VNFFEYHDRRICSILFHLALIQLAVETLSDGTRPNNNVHSILQCYVALDRLEQATIDRLMQTSMNEIESTVRCRYEHIDLNTLCVFFFFFYCCRLVTR
jgi:hypothetical protein